MKVFSTKLLFSILFFMLFSPQESLAKSYTTPTEIVPNAELPIFSDDLDFAWMQIAIDRQIKRFKQKNLNNTIKLGQKTYPQTRMLDSIKEFRKVIRSTQSCLKKQSKKYCYNKLNSTVRSKFNIYRPIKSSSDKKGGKAFFTAYNTPTIKVSKKKTKYFSHGIYAKPTNSRQRSYTRKQIDFEHKLEGTGYDLFYAHDLFELYLLHIEGGGKVEFADKSGFHYLSFDGTNKQKFNWISKYMIEQGMIDKNDRSIEAQRVYLRNNPQKEEEIYSTCPSYVYFKISKKPPIGSDSVSLTDNRSIATDSTLYRAKGLLAFVQARRPEETSRDIKMKPFSRFFLDQDTGGAIKGKARADLYFGEGAYSQKAGEHIAEWGNIYFLIKK